MSVRYKVKIVVSYDKVSEVKRSVYRILNTEKHGTDKVRIIAEVTQFMEFLLKSMFGESSVSKIQ